MKTAWFPRSLSALACACLLATAPGARAQLSGGAPGGVSAALAKLFGNISAFTANVDARVLNARNQETLRMSMKFADLDGKLRVDLDLTQVHNKDMTAKQLAAMEEHGLRKIVSIVRPDKKCSYILYPGLRNYSVVPIPKSETAALATDLETHRTPLGRETLDGHACAKQRVVLKRGDAVLLDAVTWNADDLKGFPIQIQTESDGNTSILRFENIQFTRPEDKLFEIPAGYQENQGSGATSQSR